MTALLNPPMQAELSADEVEHLTSFRFTDANPQMNRRMSQSWFRELPEFVQDIVIEVLGLGAGEWDELVEAGAALDATGIGRYSIPTTIASVRRQLGAKWGRPRRNACGDCDGTLVAIDIDGSVTGTLDAPFWCFCADGARGGA